MHCFLVGLFHSLLATKSSAAPSAAAAKEAGFMGMSSLRKELEQVSDDQAPKTGSMAAGRAAALATADADSAASSVGVSQSEEYSLFETLRDSVYSEVATVISLHEERPHFLVSQLA